ncbi:MAG: tetratricopeptide repeat protein [Limisphaerales bacterium]
MSANVTARHATRASVQPDTTHERAKIRKYGLIVSALLLIGVAFVFAQTRHFDFVVIDDGEYVTDNAQIKSGLSWATAKWTFTHTVAANWHPLAMISHALDCQVFGQNAGAHHMVNVAFHAANTVLLFWLLVTLLRPNNSSERDPITHVWMCGIVAALFGLHPLRAESVAWISERKDVLSVFFFMLTLLAYVHYVRLRATRNNVVPAYALVLGLFSLGLLAKPMLVTLPFVLLLLDFWPLNRVSSVRAARSLVVEKIPMFLVSAAASVTTFFAQKSSGSVVGLQGFPLSERLQNVTVSYARYLGKTFWPKNLCAYYPHQDWSGSQVAGAALLMLALSVLALWSMRKRPFVFVGWFWFVGMLVPVIGFAQVGGQSMADRYAYLPHVGLFIAVVWGLFALARKPALIALSIAAVAGAIVATTQVAYWRDSEVLFDRTLRLTENNISAHYFMALALETKGKKTESIPYFQEAIRGNPDNIKAITHLGRIFAEQGKTADAQKQFEAALRVDSDLPLTHINLADLLIKQGKRDEAIEHYIAAMQSQPDMPEAHFELSTLLAAKHDYEGAIAQLRIAVEQKPNFPDALNSLAWMLATQPNPKLRSGAEAVRFGEQAVALTKNHDPGLLDTLAAAYAEAGRFPDAVKTAESAVQIAAASGQTNFVTELKGRLQLYQSSMAYRE